MATVTTVTPDTTTRPHRPGIPDDGETLAGEIDLATAQGWTFLSSFVAAGLGLSYDSSGPTVAVGAGRIARHTADGQELVRVGAESGISLASDATNYLFYRADDVIEVRDADEPPGPDALLFGRVDTATGAVTERVRGRSPLRQAFSGGVPSGASTLHEDASTPAVLESQDMADAETRQYREFVADEQQLELLSAGVIADGLSPVTDLAARVRAAGGTVHHETEAKRVDGEDTPLAVVDGPADLQFELENATGSTQTGVSGRWTYRIVEIPAPPAIALWPMFQANPQHTGAGQTSGPGGAMSAAWFTQGGTFEDSPVVGDGVVYAGSDDNNLYALDASDGSEVWTVGTGDDINGAAAVVDGVVYVGNSGGTVAAYAIADGSEVWSQSVTSSINSHVTVADGVVYAGSDDNSVYALDAGDGSELWSYPTDGNVSATPTADGGTVYAGSQDNSVYALDAGDGSEQWATELNGSIHGAPTVADGTVFVGCRSDDVTGTGPENVFALDASDGSELWSVATGDYVYSSPAVVDGTVYVGNDGNTLFALDASDGSEVWTYSTGGTIQGGPAVADGIVYASAGDTVYALDAATGAPRGGFEDFGQLSSPAVADGRVFVASQGGAVLAAGAGEPIPSAHAATYNAADGSGTQHDLTGVWSDGSALYLSASDTGTVYYHTADNDWDLSAVTYDDISLDTSAEVSTLSGTTFSSQQTTHIAVDAAGSLYAYGRPFLPGDPYTGGALDVSGEVTTAQEAAFDASESRLFVLGQGTPAIASYSLSTAGDITTATPTGTTLDLSSETATPTGFAFDQRTGGELFVCDADGTVFRYRLEAAFDLSTASHTGETLDVSASAPTPTDVAFYAGDSQIGRTLFVTCSETQAIHEFGES